MVVIVTCKNKEVLIKNTGARVVTRLFIYFSNAQGQLTPKSVMESCQNSNSSSELAEFRTHPSFFGFLVTCKNEEVLIKK